MPTTARGTDRSRLRPGKTEGQTMVAVSTDEGLPVVFSTDELLGEILTQMKIQNAHLALITGEEELDVSDN